MYGLYGYILGPSPVPAPKWGGSVFYYITLRAAHTLCAVMHMCAVLPRTASYREQGRPFVETLFDEG